MRWLFIPGFVVLGLACGNQVTHFQNTSESATTTTTNTNTTAVTSGGTGGSTTTVGAGGWSGECERLTEAACMAAFPTCAPAYDDVCCPSCVPGPCADCSDYEFYQCGPSDVICAIGDACWLAPEWACNGGTPQCPSIAEGEYVCNQAPGCVVAECSPDVNCMAAECHPVTGSSCTNNCDSAPPSCPVGMVAEADGFCYTGFCIPGDVCGAL